jgi:hypothetical protein
MRIADCELRIVSHRPRRAALVVVALLFPAPLCAQPPDVRADAKADRELVALSGSVRVTLTLDGPAPLRVKLPDQLLTADADPAWRIRADGSATITPLANGREEWRQVYRLDPYLPGDPLVVSFNPATVNGQQVPWPAVGVKVTKTVGEATTAAARPPVGPEDPPSPLPSPQSGPVPAWVVVVFGVMCGAVLGAAWMRRRKPKPVPPVEWALAALAKLEAGAGGTEIVERVATILRTFVERRFAIPATRLTTAELSAAAREQGWPVEQAEPLRALLDECDRAKFAGDVPDDDGCRRLVRRAVDWVNDIGRPAGPG